MLCIIIIIILILLILLLYKLYKCNYPHTLLMQGEGNDKLEEVISIDSNYSAHVTDVNHASNPQYLFIYIHGMVPGGRLYSPMFIQSLLHTKYKNNSYFSKYKRKSILIQLIRNSSNCSREILLKILCSDCHCRISLCRC